MRINHLYPRSIHAISSAFGFAILFITWILFAPIQTGGLASYVIVIGSSMEPNFHIGDLVIVHKEPFYQIGDAVVYRNLDLQSFVFHRIVSEEKGHYALQGDNNKWVDNYQPAKEEILGKLWIYVPHGGKTIQKMRSPVVMTLIAAVLGLFLSTSKKPKGNIRMNKKSIREWFTSIRQKIQTWFVQINNSEPVGSSNFNQGEMQEAFLIVLGIVLLLSIFIGIISFSRPAFRLVSDDIEFQHLGIFSYMAPAPQDVYDSNTINSGDPIFPRLTCSVDVNLQYTLIAPNSKDITGTYQLTAIIQEQSSGWQRRVPLQEATSFNGTTFGTTAKLDLCKMESLTQSMEQETEFHPGTYTLLVSPNIKVNGEVSGHKLEDTFATGLTFLYDHVHFFMNNNENSESPLSFTEMGAIHTEQLESNVYKVLGIEFTIPTLRWMAVIGLLLSLTGFVVFGLRLQNFSRNNQAQFFRMKYVTLIVDIERLNSFDPNAVEVRSMDALAKLAERFNTTILHVEEVDTHVYYVRSAGITYRYELKSIPAIPVAVEHESHSHGGEL
jgi:signal peptidase I